MARSKYWGIPVAREVKEGVLVSMRIDQKFVVTRKIAGKETKLQEFHPGDILDETENTLERKFKKFIRNCTKEKFVITYDVQKYLSKMETRLLKR